MEQEILQLPKDCDRDAAYHGHCSKYVLSICQGAGKENAKEWVYQLTTRRYFDTECMTRKLKDEHEKWGLNGKCERTKYLCFG